MKRVNVIDIAERCGVSPSTVCRALNNRSDVNEKTRRKILATCHELGYSKNLSASNLRLRETNVISCLMPDANNELFIEKLHFLKNAVIAAGYQWNLKSCNNSEEAVANINEAIGARSTGIIVSYSLDSTILKTVQQNSIPLIGYDVDLPDTDSVELNRGKGVYEAVVHLINKGRKKIILMGADLSSKRGIAYVAALEDNEIKINDNLVIDMPFGRNLYQYGYEQICTILGKLDFDSVIAVNDACAIGAIRALAENGIKVPDQISIVGFDNIMSSRFINPPLTTVSQPKEEMAERTIEFLINRIRDFNLPRQYTKFSTDLIVRNST